MKRLMIIGLFMSGIICAVDQEEIPLQPVNALVNQIVQFHIGQNEQNNNDNFVLHRRDLTQIDFQQIKARRKQQALRKKENRRAADMEHIRLYREQAPDNDGSDIEC